MGGKSGGERGPRATVQPKTSGDDDGVRWNGATQQPLCMSACDAPKACLGVVVREGEMEGGGA